MVQVDHSRESHRGTAKIAPKGTPPTDQVYGMGGEFGGFIFAWSGTHWRKRTASCFAVLSFGVITFMI